MDATPLLHKPVVYGSDLANLAFIALLSVHVAMAAAAVVTGVVAVVTRKGGHTHRRIGAWFASCMIGTALTGVVLDAIRLTSHVADNHTKYADRAMPSSYPARFAFLFAALCVLFLAYRGVDQRAFVAARPRPGSPPRWRLDLPVAVVAGALVALGVLTAAIIVARFNPWTGALWMVATFTAGVAVAARLVLVGASRTGAAGRRARASAHGFIAMFLVAFSWWGALQGFGPAIATAIAGIDPSLGPYTGDQPGRYSAAFWGFLLVWAPSFALAAFLLVRRRRSALA